jgi:hypothetical protein
MATLAKLLQTDMSLPDMAKRLAASGRGKDTILAHINPKEMALLKKHGGSGKVNPNTGVMEFDDTDYSDYGPTPTETSTPMFQEAAPASQEPYVAPPPAAPAPDQSQAETNRLASYNYVPQTQQPISPGAFDSAAFVQPTQAPAPVPQAPVASRSLAPTAPTAPNPIYDFGDVRAEAAPERSFGQRVEQFGEDVSKTLQPYGRGASAISKALDPFVPYGKVAFDLYSQYQQRKAAEAADAKSAENQARLEALATPYRERAAQVAQQGQALVQAGQAGQLTAQQQQRLEAARAQAVQQATASGMDTGTAQMQTEAQLARIAAQFAQENINQGITLINNANVIEGQADAIITGAIKTGYQQSAAATQLAQNYAKNIGYQLPQTQSKGPA